jgi:predicted ABC-type ATPase
VSEEQWRAWTKHNVPEKTIRRRYEKGWYNFQNTYKQSADAWVLFDNAGMTPKLLDKGGRDI